MKINAYVVSVIDFLMIPNVKTNWSVEPHEMDFQLSWNVCCYIPRGHSRTIKLLESIGRREECVKQSDTPVNLWHHHHLEHRGVTVLYYPLEAFEMINGWSEIRRPVIDDDGCVPILLRYIPITPSFALSPFKVPMKVGN